MVMVSKLTPRNRMNRTEPTDVHELAQALRKHAADVKAETPIADRNDLYEKLRGAAVMLDILESRLYSEERWTARPQPPRRPDPCGQDRRKRPSWMSPTKA